MSWNNLRLSEGKARYNRISINPNVCYGQACFKGIRIPAHEIVRMLANGDSIDDLLKAYPTIK